MTPRERINRALSHKQPDKLPVDFGGVLTSGINVSTVYKLRQKLGLDSPGTPVKVVEPYQMLGEIAVDLKEYMGIDTAALLGENNFFGFKNEGWRQWKLDDGTPVLIPELFNTKKNSDGSIYMYAGGDKSYSPAAKMPKDGFYFDLEIRQQPIDDSKLNVEDNTEEFGLLNDSDLKYIKDETDRLYSTDRAIIASLVLSGFGDIALVPGPTLKDPKGIRDISEWYMSTASRKDYIKNIFSAQLEIAIENYKKIYETVGNKIEAVFVSGTDFGAQNGPFISKDSYRELFKPYHKRVNKWIHDNTDWYSFMHCCGSIYELIPEFIDAGFDILNPVQISATNMDPASLKSEYGKDITFWGGGIDTQKTLPFGTPEQVKEEAKRLIDIFSPGGGFVFNAIHNIQAGVPVDNIIAMFEVVREYR